MQNKISIKFKLKNIRLDLFGIRIIKFIYLLKFPKLWPFILRGIMPGFEHLIAINKAKRIKTLIDCGSNKGQFALVLYMKKRFKKYISFDPIIEPYQSNKFLEKNKVDVHYFPIALSDKKGEQSFFVSEREDSSSLKKIKPESINFFSDVFCKNIIKVPVEIFDNFEELIETMPPPIALKIDVQGSELDLLKGAENILHKFQYIFIEIAYEGLYKNIGSSSDIFKFLEEKDFYKTYSYNTLKRNGKILSKDFLFTRKSIN